MKYFPVILIITTMALTGCDSKEEQARKKALENKADSLEDQAKATKNAADREAKATEEGKSKLDRKAESIRIEGKREADALKDAAKETRDQK